MLLPLALFGLTACAQGLNLPSFARPTFPPSTIDNDGTFFGRYDVRKTMALLDPDPRSINSYFFTFWLTTVDGGKYHATLNPFLTGSTASAGTFSLNDLTTLESKGAVAFGPASGSVESLNVQSATHNLSSPVGSDNYTTMKLDGDYAGFALNTIIHPTGPNIYFGGSGGMSLPGNTGNDTNVPIGWSWYWGNPHLQVEGTVTVNGTALEIDSSQSFGFLERQYGLFSVGPKGFILFWLYLPSGEFVHIWVVSPHEDGTGDAALATVWHPNGLHQNVPVDMNTTRAWDESVGATGRRYFNKFQVGLPAINASFTINKWIRDAECAPPAAAAAAGVTPLSESYCDGEALWNGETVPVFGHCEQLSALFTEN
ncbi:hypothetical protein KVR01_010013 [Diaporthe batatas]|uniref:uncharacterized protein n=1 Tax=Diaporthe batatas TaxID=748121 RepID=UPI001D03F74F|nr:uncharacterized protein KVR01_010013 [Diaporthe batatas]KAG8160477.1 hypothetical protein KVR01_010013 [Diaporthe batatas]